LFHLLAGRFFRVDDRFGAVFRRPSPFPVASGGYGIAIPSSMRSRALENARSPALPPMPRHALKGCFPPFESPLEGLSKKAAPLDPFGSPVQFQVSDGAAHCKFKCLNASPV